MPSFNPLPPLLPLRMFAKRTVGTKAHGRFREAPVGHRTGGQQHLEDLAGPLHQLGVRRASSQLAGFVHGEVQAITEKI